MSGPANLVNSLYSFAVTSLIQQPELASEITTETMLRLQQRHIHDKVPALQQMWRVIAETYPEANGAELKGAAAEFLNSTLLDLDVSVTPQQVDHISKEFPKLPRTQRQLLWLYYCFGLNMADLAFISGFAEPTLRAELSTGFQALLKKFNANKESTIPQDVQMVGALTRYSHAPQFMPEARFKHKVQNLLESQVPDEKPDKKTPVAAAASMSQWWENFKLPPQLQNIIRKRWFFPAMLALILLLTVLIFALAGVSIFGDKPKNNEEITLNPGEEETNGPIDTTGWQTYDSEVLGMSIRVPPTWNINPEPGFTKSLSSDTNIKPVAVPGVSLGGILNIIAAPPQTSFAAGYTEVANNEVSATTILGKVKVITAVTLQARINQPADYCQQDSYSRTYYAQLTEQLYAFFPVTYTTKCVDGKVSTSSVPDTQNLEIIRAALGTIAVKEAQSPTQDWKSLLHEDIGIIMKYPPTWTEVSKFEVTGGDGETLTLSLTTPGEIPGGWNTFCANYPKTLGTSRYGSTPFTQADDAKGLCYIYPSKDQNDSFRDVAAVLVKLPAATYVANQSYFFVTVEIDKDLLETAASTITTVTPALKPPKLTATEFDGYFYKITFPSNWATKLEVSAQTGFPEKLTLTGPHGTTLSIGVEGDHSHFTGPSKTKKTNLTLSVLNKNYTTEEVQHGECNPDGLVSDCNPVSSVPVKDLIRINDLFSIDSAAVVGGVAKKYQFLIDNSFAGVTDADAQARFDGYQADLAEIKNFIKSFASK